MPPVAIDACDYTAGLTDGLAVRTYKRLFDADFGSIAECSN